MKLPKSTVVAALVTSSLAMGFGTAHAAPEASAPQEPVNYAVQLVEKTVVATIAGGTFSIVEKEAEPDPAAPEPGVAEAEPIAESAKTKVLEIKDKTGDLVASMPLEFMANGVEIPVTSEIKNDGSVIEINPEKPAGLEPGNTVLHPVAQPIASPAENQLAMSEFLSYFGLATAIGGFVGTAIGFVVGCVVIPVIGCIPGAGLGGIIGTIAVGGPTMVAAGTELINTMQAPEGSTKWANEGKPVGATK